MGKVSDLLGAKNTLSGIKLVFKEGCEENAREAIYSSFFLLCSFFFTPTFKWVHACKKKRGKSVFFSLTFVTK